MHSFKFNLGDFVQITCSGETGQIIGRAQYTHSQDAYLLRHQNGQGVAVEAWWSDDALSVPA